MAELVADTAVSIPQELGSNSRQRDDTALIVHAQRRSSRIWNWRYALGIAGLAVFFAPFTTAASWLMPVEVPIDPSDYALRTRRVLKSTPLIDGHNDLPWLLRIELQNRIYDGRFDPTQRLLGHTDINRMKQGLMGGQFWSVHVHCDKTQKHFDDPSVRHYGSIQ
jgi:membrane dipeptidase